MAARNVATASALTQKQRESKAMDLRLSGMTYGEIAAAVGYKSRTSAWRAIKRVLDRQVQRTNKAGLRLLQLELDRLDVMQAALWPKVVGKNPDARAVEACLKIMQHRARLLGLNAPTSIHITAGPAENVRKEVDQLKDMDPNEIAAEYGREIRQLPPLRLVGGESE